MTHSGAAAAIAPEPDGPGPMATADDASTGTDFDTWERQLVSTGFGMCANPIRLHGRIDAIDRATGETRPVYKTWADVEVPAGEGLTETVRVSDPLHVACGNRRESVCPACSRLYKRDARQLVRAGLAG